MSKTEKTFCASDCTNSRCEKHNTFDFLYTNLTNQIVTRVNFSKDCQDYAEPLTIPDFLRRNND